MQERPGPRLRRRRRLRAVKQAFPEPAEQRAGRQDVEAPLRAVADDRVRLAAAGVPVGEKLS